MRRPRPLVDDAREARWLYAAGPAAAATLAVLSLATGQRALTAVCVAAGAAGALVGALVPPARAERLEELVTPLSDPRAEDGRLLRPIDVHVL